MAKAGYQARTGRKLEDPVALDWRPDLKGNIHEINEYLEEQGAYDLFDYMLKDLMIRQPADPLQHMLECLEKTPGTQNGPLKVIVSSPPGLGRENHARQLAKDFDLVYIGAGELLRQSKVDTTKIGYANDAEVAKLVMDMVKQAEMQMRGFVLDGFPRTAAQTTYLKEKSVVPTHVLVLKASEEFVMDHHRRIAEGEISGDFIKPEVLHEKLRMHACHNALALEVYKGKTSVIDSALGSEDILATMVSAVRMRPRSKGPAPPPRVVILGPLGVGAPEHAARLAERFGAVFVNGKELLAPNMGPEGSSPVTPVLFRLAQQDPLRVVGARLRQKDCTKQGWVLSGFPLDAHTAGLLGKDAHLSPTRVVKLEASAEACEEILSHILKDPVTGKVWTDVPENETIRQRLIRDPEHQPDAVKEAHQVFEKEITGILQALGADRGRCVELACAGRSPKDIYDDLLEFVERPLPLPKQGGS
mmetsp:Transcript_48235/g.86978  ORF Transcript_48235/g.86978 Transcript_48235/m.86978 type:complete len:474 (+) Transcript_48235:65-1486(+)|eukprot:CAMPEP_0197650994 /NCGR_PEP_ID=MMETSP1338-20131121/31285_1 /TAXON_ID=43686 ORGANISM="Pelagodinium beii, Strain RCC1491" /NCGR_SAMPLE_ID=MMETSP1338 /ASSEMBLY_ACC=CAM_ASM_000754 /LENGTH=473 /DNA_ID=CAMNT_0043225527 /DNA_START=68 /DNA_END=1489 /DNA_ORIENTATION=-